MATVNDYKTARNYNAEALGGDDATLDNLSGVSSVIVQAPLGHGVAQFYAEGDAATYAPSNEPMGVSSPQMNPTNSEPTLFCAEHGADGCGCMKMDAESKSMFTKGTKGKMFARKRNGRIITHNAEGDSAIYAPSNEPQSSSPQTNPTNSEPNLFGAESKAMFTKDKRGKMYARKRNGRIITRNAHQGYNDEMDESMGMRHRGSHSQSMKDRRDEASSMDDMGGMGRKYDDVMTMDAEHDVDILYESWKDGELTDEETLSLIDMLITHDRKKLSHMIRWIQDENSEGMSNLRMGIKERFGSEFVPNGDGRITGQQDFVYNGTPFHSESYEADYALEKPFVTGAKLSAGLLTGAAMFGIAGMAITALFGEMLNRGE